MDTTLIDSSKALCARAKTGDMQAASQLVTLHYERIYAYLRRLSGSDDEAADLTQKTFSKVWAALASYQGRSSFSTWLHGLARNVYLDWRRRGDRLDARTDEWWEARATDGPSPYEDTAERDQAAHLHALVTRLDDEKRDVIHLHYYQGLSLQDTAEVLGVAASTVKYRLRAALEALRARSAEWNPSSKLKGEL